MAAGPGWRARIETAKVIADAWSTIFVIHRTTVALAWQTGFACAFRWVGWPGDAPVARPLPSNERLQFRSLVLVSKQMVQLVGLVVELTDVLELEAQHQGAVRLEAERIVLDEGLDVARRQ